MAGQSRPKSSIYFPKASLNHSYVHCKDKAVHVLSKDGELCKHCTVYHVISGALGDIYHFYVILEFWLILCPLK